MCSPYGNFTGSAHELIRNLYSRIILLKLLPHLPVASELILVRVGKEVLKQVVFAEPDQI